MILWNQFRLGCRYSQIQSSCAHASGFSSRSVTEPVARATCNYTIEEVTIPVPSSPDGGTVLAGQLWKGEQNSSTRSLPPILCAHGLLDNAGSFTGLLPLIMKPNMTAFAIDFPGHGLSSHLTTGHYDLVIDCCKSLIRAFNYLDTSKVILLGHSMGALTSFLFSALYPEKVEHLISLDAHPFTVPKPLQRLKFLMERQMAIDDKLAQIKPNASYSYGEILQRFYLGRVKGVTLEGCKNLIQRGTRKLPDGKYVFSYDPRAYVPCSPGRYSMVEVNDICASIKCPVTLIRAESMGEIGFEVSYEQRLDQDEVVKFLLKYNPNVDVHTVPGTHFVHINDPGIVAPIISASLGF